MFLIRVTNKKLITVKITAETKVIYTKVINSCTSKEAGIEPTTAVLKTAVLPLNYSSNIKHIVLK